MNNDATPFAATLSALVTRRVGIRLGVYDSDYVSEYTRYGPVGYAEVPPVWPLALARDAQRANPAVPISDAIIAIDKHAAKSPDMLIALASNCCTEDITRGAAGTCSARAAAAMCFSCMFLDDPPSHTARVENSLAVALYCRTVRYIVARAILAQQQALLLYGAPKHPAPAFIHHPAETDARDVWPPMPPLSTSFGAPVVVPANVTIASTVDENGRREATAMYTRMSDAEEPVWVFIPSDDRKANAHLHEMLNAAGPARRTLIIAADAPYGALRASRMTAIAHNCHKFTRIVYLDISCADCLCGGGGRCVHAADVAVYLRRRGMQDAAAQRKQRVQNGLARVAASRSRGMYGGGGNHRSMGVVGNANKITPAGDAIDTDATKRKIVYFVNDAAGTDKDSNEDADALAKDVTERLDANLMNKRYKLVKIDYARYQKLITTATRKRRRLAMPIVLGGFDNRTDRLLSAPLIQDAARTIEGKPSLRVVDLSVVHASAAREKYADADPPTGGPLSTPFLITIGDDPDPDRTLSPSNASNCYRYNISIGDTTDAVGVALAEFERAWATIAFIVDYVGIIEVRIVIAAGQGVTASPPRRHIKSSSPPHASLVRRNQLIAEKIGVPLETAADDLDTVGAQEAGVAQELFVPVTLVQPAFSDRPYALAGAIATARAVSAVDINTNKQVAPGTEEEIALAVHATITRDYALAAAKADEIATDLFLHGVMDGVMRALEAAVDANVRAIEPGADANSECLDAAFDVYCAVVRYSLGFVARLNDTAPAAMRHIMSRISAYTASDVITHAIARWAAQRADGTAADNIALKTAQLTEIGAGAKYAFYMAPDADPDFVAVASDDDSAGGMSEASGSDDEQSEGGEDEDEDEVLPDAEDYRFHVADGAEKFDYKSFPPNEAPDHIQAMIDDTALPVLLDTQYRAIMWFHRYAVCGANEAPRDAVGPDGIDSVSEWSQRYATGLPRMPLVNIEYADPSGIGPSREWQYLQNGKAPVHATRVPREFLNRRVFPSAVTFGKARRDVTYELVHADDADRYRGEINTETAKRITNAAYTMAEYRQAIRLLPRTDRAVVARFLHLTEAGGGDMTAKDARDRAAAADLIREHAMRLTMKAYTLFISDDIQRERAMRLMYTEKGERNGLIRWEWGASASTDEYGSRPPPTGASELLGVFGEAFDTNDRLDLIAEDKTEADKRGKVNAEAIAFVDNVGEQDLTDEQRVVFDELFARAEGVEAGDAIAALVGVIRAEVDRVVDAVKHAMATSGAMDDDLRTRYNNAMADADMVRKDRWRDRLAIAAGDGRGSRSSPGAKRRRARGILSRGARAVCPCDNACPCPCTTRDCECGCCADVYSSTSSSTSSDSDSGSSSEESIELP